MLIRHLPRNILCIVANSPARPPESSREAGVCLRRKLGEAEPGGLPPPAEDGEEGREGLKVQGERRGRWGSLKVCPAAGVLCAGTPHHLRSSCPVKTCQWPPAAFPVEARLGLGALAPPHQVPAGKFSSASALQATSLCPALRFASLAHGPFPLGWPNRPDLLRTEGFAGTPTQSFETRPVRGKLGWVDPLVPEAQTPHLAPAHAQLSAQQPVP